MLNTLDSNDRIKLREFLEQRFSLEELDTLAWDLGLDCNKLPHSTKGEFARELIDYFERRESLKYLIAMALRQRPDEDLARLYAKLPSGSSRTKVQIIIAQDTLKNPSEVIEDLAKKLEIDVDQVELIGMARGSVCLLISLPQDAANVLARSEVQDLVNGKYRVISITAFDSLDEKRQMAWRQLVRSPKQLHYEMEFANRTYELDEICGPGAKFILVDAPAGYGKSFLLQKVRNIYAERKGWVIVLVDLKSQQDMSSARAGVARAAIANDIARQVEAKESFYPRDDEKITIAKINQLLQPRGEKFLLLFDGVEVLSDDTVNWLRNMPNTLEKGPMSIAKKTLHAVWAGRYARNWTTNCSFSLRVLKLKPFDFRVIYPLVSDALAQSLKRDLEQTFIDIMTTYTHWVSGGHPKGICGIVSELARLDAVPFDIEDYFFQNNFEVTGRSETLFDLYVKPIVKEILGSMRVGPVLETISVFRKFNKDTLDILIQDNEIKDYRSGWELQTELLKTHLIDGPDRFNPMYSDGVLRRMLAFQMCLTNRERYERLNKRAREIFHTWAQGQQLEGVKVSDKIKDQLQLVSIVESLYHTLVLQQHVVKLNKDECAAIGKDNETKILDEFAFYRKESIIKDPDCAKQLEDILEHDEEFLDLARSRMGETGLQKLLDEVKRASKS